MAPQKQSTSAEDADAIATTTRTWMNTSVITVTIILSTTVADATDRAILHQIDALAHQTV